MSEVRTCLGSRQKQANSRRTNQLSEAHHNEIELWQCSILLEIMDNSASLLAGRPVKAGIIITLLLPCTAMELSSILKASGFAESFVQLGCLN